MGKITTKEGLFIGVNGISNHVHCEWAWRLDESLLGIEPLRIFLFLNKVYHEHHSRVILAIQLMHVFLHNCKSSYVIINLLLSQDNYPIVVSTAIEASLMILSLCFRNQDKYLVYICPSSSKDSLFSMFLCWVLNAQIIVSL